ncbi:response regulator [Paenibacillus sp. TAB 01]|uniref:response regulator n=1 Tax=Paenibacillus sp. TAB 01 TaxID=3368988 RepID=UPI003752B947
MAGSIMIVDDEPLIRRGLRKLIETNELGWSVAGEASNGQEALLQLEQLKPNLILSDIRMPVMDGLELARHISERNCGTAVILLTGFRDFEYAQAAVRYGVKDFLLKPCPEEEICRVLRQAYEQLRVKAEQRRVREEPCLALGSPEIASTGRGAAPNDVLAERAGLLAGQRGDVSP